MASIAASARPDGRVAAEVRALLSLCDGFEAIVDGQLASGSNPTALANATGFLKTFGYFVLGWLWLGLARAAARHPAWRRPSCGYAATTSPSKSRRWRRRWIGGAAAAGVEQVSHQMPISRPSSRECVRSR